MASSRLTHAVQEDNIVDGITSGADIGRNIGCFKAKPLPRSFFRVPFICSAQDFIYLTYSSTTRNELPIMTVAPGNPTILKVFFYYLGLVVRVMVVRVMVVRVMVAACVRYLLNFRCSTSLCLVTVCLSANGF